MLIRFAEGLQSTVDVKLKNSESKPKPNHHLNLIKTHQSLHHIPYTKFYRRGRETILRELTNGLQRK
jgi:hypothetical protein